MGSETPQTTNPVPMPAENSMLTQESREVRCRVWRSKFSLAVTTERQPDAEHQKDRHRDEEDSTNCPKDTVGDLLGHIGDLLGPKQRERGGHSAQKKRELKDGR